MVRNKKFTFELVVNIFFFFSQKFIIALMFVAVASAGRIQRKRDISEYVGQGWTKGADGYSYDIPQTNLETANAVETYYEEPVYTAPVATATYAEPADTTVVDTSYTAGGDYEVVADYVAEPEYTQDQSLREYLPPALRRRRLRLQKRRLRFAKRH